MFTGIVEEIGRLTRREARGNLLRLWFRADAVLADCRLGDSLAHNGVCLTVAELRPPEYACDVMAESLRRTTLGDLREGDTVNLERALAVGGRFGGHIVQGHIDGLGRIQRVRREDQWIIYWIEAPDEVLAYTVTKGSVAVDGVSLTVAETAPSGFAVSLIPHTLAVTTLGRRREGDAVNLEADVLAKYVAAAVARQAAPAAGGISLDWLAEQGYGATE